PGYRKMLGSSVNAIVCQLGYGPVCWAWRRAIADRDDRPDRQCAEVHSRGHGNMVGTAVDSIHDQVSALIEGVEDALGDQPPGDRFGKLGISEGRKVSALSR